MWKEETDNENDDGSVISLLSVCSAKFCMTCVDKSDVTPLFVLKGQRDCSREEYIYIFIQIYSTLPIIHEHSHEISCINDTVAYPVNARIMYKIF